MPVRQAQAILSQYWNRQIPVDPAQIARDAGAQIFADYSMSADDLSGCFDIENGVPTIRFNPDDAWVRQRFTIAHELGHMILGHGRAMRDNSQNYRESANHYIEREANTFAAELLMPREVIDWMIHQGRTDIGQMSRDLGVSEMAMRYRLRNLGYNFAY